MSVKACCFLIVLGLIIIVLDVLQEDYKQGDIPKSRKIEYIIAFSGLIITLIIVLLWGTKKIVFIVSDSMNPAIKKGTLAIIDKGDINNIEIGDIICYKDTNNNKDIVHRVIEKEILDTQEVILRTKGDNNLSADNIEVTTKNYIGKIGIYVYIKDIILEILPKIIIVICGILGYIKICIKKRRSNSG